MARIASHRALSLAGLAPPPARPSRNPTRHLQDIMDDDGTFLEGTQSTADDYVSWGEFRLLNAYLCIYAAMYDAFMNIDSSGSCATRIERA